MKNLKPLLIILLVCNSNLLIGQVSSKINQEFAEPILVDSNSTIIIPIEYNSGLFTSNKLSWSYYANIIFYNFKEDKYKKLFEKDTYIHEFKTFNYSRLNSDIKKYSTSKVIFFFVKNVDYNNDGKINEDDPSILYKSDTQGNNLLKLTSESESAVSLEIFEKQKFALIKIQRNVTNDKVFNFKDNDYYYIKLDLDTFKLGNKIEIK